MKERPQWPGHARILAVVAVHLSIIFAAGPSLAGEAGEVSCTAPGCGFQRAIKIGGAKHAPSVTGYCPSSGSFVQVKLESWDEYRRRHTCPGSKEPLQAIYEGEQISHFPCPRCGNKTLRYQRIRIFNCPGGRTARRCAARR